jgi:hypothetical protein
MVIGKDPFSVSTPWGGGYYRISTLELVAILRDAAVARSREPGECFASSYSVPGEPVRN